MRALFEKAYTIGMEAGKAVECRPMHLRNNATGEVFTVDEGPCGFAWVNVKPGNCRFANFLKAEGLARRDSYYGGVTIWCREFNQSHTRKAAWATAVSAELQKYGLRASAGERLD
jgi:hypothetical protein